MQLDQTKITIRERSLGELLDLAFRFTVLYFKPLFCCTVILVIPFAVFNWWVTHPIVDLDNTAESNWRCIWYMSQLVFLEAPLATIITTLFLGRVMFLQEVSYRSLIKESWHFLGRILWSQLIVRGGLLLFVFVFYFPIDESLLDSEMLLLMLCIGTVVIRASRPFVNEIILLERNPIRSKEEGVITVGRRSRALHRPSVNDLVASWLLTAFACVVVFVSLLSSFWFANGVLLGQWQIRTIFVEVYVPVALWLIVIFSTVVRFLLYLDLRIRREGWEIELKVRAAANELKEQLV